jgi:hypothetical protein
MRSGKDRSMILGKARQMEEAAEMTDFLAVQSTSAEHLACSGGHSGQVSPIESSTLRMFANGCHKRCSSSNRLIDGAAVARETRVDGDQV